MSKKKVWKTISIVLFIIYCFFVLWITILKRTAEVTRSYELRLFWGLTELVTGKGNGEFVSAQYLLNILFFIPFGLLFPWKRKWWISVVTACVFSVLIEFTQYVTARGLCELDDVVANSIGALIGIGLYVLIKELIRRKTQSVR